MPKFILSWRRVTNVGNRYYHTIKTEETGYSEHETLESAVRDQRALLDAGGGHSYISIIMDPDDVKRNLSLESNDNIT